LQPPEALTRILREGQATHRVPSLSAAAHRGDEVVWTDTVGVADANGTEPSPEAQYRIGSISKTFTAASVLALRDEGRLALDDPLSAYIPDAHHGAPTLRRLLAHSSGIQREPPGEVWETMEFPRGQALVDSLPDAEQLLEPGDWFHYSNLAYALLGEVVARVSGRPYTAFVDERFIGPLGLSRTTWTPEPPAATGYYVEPFARTLVAEPRLDGDGAEAVGSLWSTPSDLCRWAMHLATVEAMHQVQVMNDLDGWTVGHGLGLQLFRSGERVFFGHGGAMPGFLAMVLGRRKEGIGAAILTNASTPSTAVESVCLELAEKALEVYALPPEAWHAEAEPPAEVDELLGVWWTEGTPFVFWWEGGTLKARPQETTKERLTSVFAADGPDRFRVVEGRERGELLRVVRAADGSIEKLYWATYPVTRRPSAFQSAK
jgi:CubicO group peptidase (beta-lactamase class C family)